jgi:hypothetical protein
VLGCGGRASGSRPAGEGATGYAFGRTLRRVGDLRLLGLPVGPGRERYGVADGFEPLAAYPTLEQALAAFEAVREATDDAAHRRRLAAGGVADPAAYRRRRCRSREGAPPAPRLPGTQEP